MASGRIPGSGHSLATIEVSLCRHTFLPARQTELIFGHFVNFFKNFLFFLRFLCLQ